ncbi:hypothetical protein FRB97_006335 [Tulasnella sp. 331]|nr:hypothetical protein FRB97_006335 [Tulasnella sp. 331]
MANIDDSASRSQSTVVQNEAGSSISGSSTGSSSIINLLLPRPPPPSPSASASLPPPQLFASRNGLLYYHPQRLVTSAPANGDPWLSSSLPINMGLMPYGGQYPSQQPTLPVNRYPSIAMPSRTEGDKLLLQTGTYHGYRGSVAVGGLQSPEYTSLGTSDPPPTKRRKLQSGATGITTAPSVAAASSVTATLSGASSSSTVAPPSVASDEGTTPANAFWYNQYVSATNSANQILSAKRMITPVTTDVPADLANTPVHELIEEITDAETMSDLICDPADFEGHTSSIDGSSSGVRPWPRFKCKICKHAFPKKHTVLTHLKTHLGMKPYLCSSPGCKMSFVREHDRKRHESTHTGYRGYSCECGKQFTRQDALRRHASYHQCNPANAVQYPLPSSAESASLSPTPSLEEPIVPVVPLLPEPATVAPTRPVRKGRPRKAPAKTKEPKSHKDPPSRGVTALEAVALGSPQLISPAALPDETDTKSIELEPRPVVSRTPDVGTPIIPVENPTIGSDGVVEKSVQPKADEKSVVTQTPATLKPAAKRPPGRPKKVAMKRKVAGAPRRKLTKVDAPALRAEEQAADEQTVNSLYDIEAENTEESSFLYKPEGGNDVRAPTLEPELPSPPTRLGTPALPARHPSPRRSESPTVLYVSSEDPPAPLYTDAGDQPASLPSVRLELHRAAFFVEKLLIDQLSLAQSSSDGMFALREVDVSRLQHWESLTVADVLGNKLDIELKMDEGSDMDEDSEVESWDDDDGDSVAEDDSIDGTPIDAHFSSSPVLGPRPALQLDLVAEPNSTQLRLSTSRISTPEPASPSSDMSLDTPTPSSNMSLSSTPSPLQSPIIRSRSLLFA